VALEAAVLDIDEGDWKGGLKKLNAIFEKYSTVLQLDDNKDLLEQVQRNRGIALFEMRRFGEARPILETVRSLVYQRERTLCSLGMCNYELEDLDAAKRDFEELLSLNPGPLFQAYSHYYLGRILYAHGQHARAKAELEKCLASTTRGDVSDQILLQGLIYSCKALNLEDEAAHYSAMLKKAQVAP
jgi:tetratricopeptide (TPR) repeat protein